MKKNDEWTDIIKKKEKQEIGTKGSVKKLIAGSLNEGRLKAEPNGERSSKEYTPVGTYWRLGAISNGRGWTGQGLERGGDVRKEEAGGGTSRKFGSNICSGEKKEKKEKLNIFDGFPCSYDRMQTNFSDNPNKLPGEKTEQR